MGSSSYRFDDVYATNGTIQTSDARLKKQIKKSDLGLDFINELNPVSYHWKKNDNGRHYGLIAQELLAVFNKHGIESVDEIATVDWDEESDRYGLHYAELISPMIKAVQEQQGQIEELKSELKSQYEKLTKQNQDLLKMVSNKTNNQGDFKFGHKNVELGSEETYTGSD